MGSARVLLIVAAAFSLMGCTHRVSAPEGVVGICHAHPTGKQLPAVMCVSFEDYLKMSDEAKAALQIDSWDGAGVCYKLQAPELSCARLITPIKPTIQEQIDTEMMVFYYNLASKIVRDSGLIRRI